MPNLHDIEKRIKSVSSTKQITRTMEIDVYKRQVPGLGDAGDRIFGTK